MIWDAAKESQTIDNAARGFVNTHTLSGVATYSLAVSGTIMRLIYQIERNRLDIEQIKNQLNER